MNKQELINKLTGHYHSNDMGYKNEDGFIFLAGRKDEIIISGGENIDLNEIIKIVMNLDFVIDCVPIPIKHKRWEQSYVLLVATKINSKTLEHKISDILQENFGKYKLPQKIYLVDEIKRNEMGKFLNDSIKNLIKEDFL